MDLNIPDTRQQILIQRLSSGDQIVAADVALEFDVSVDTVRRDLIALEQIGKAHRVRGGAIPIVKPMRMMHEKINAGVRPSGKIINAALGVLKDHKTIILDGGSTILALAQALRPTTGLLVITPSPWIAIACLENDIETLMLGGQLNAHGGVTVGIDCNKQLGDIAAEIAVLGACGVDPEFGLSSDDILEAAAKQQMAQAAAQTMVLADKTILGARARHKTLPPTEINTLITNAVTDDCHAYRQQGIEIIHV